MQAKPLEGLPELLPLDLVLGRFQVHKAKVQGSLGVSVLVNDVLNSKGIMHGAEVWPIACFCCKAPGNRLIDVSKTIASLL